MQTTTRNEVDPAIANAAALARAGQLAAAASAFLAAGEAMRDWRLANEAGICFFRLERYDDAVRCYERALALEPTNIDVRMKKAVALALAMQCVRAIFQIDPQDMP